MLSSVSFFIARTSQGISPGDASFRPAVIGAESPDGVLIPSRGVSVTTTKNKRDGGGVKRECWGGVEGGVQTLRDGEEAVKWTTAVAIETLLATQRCRSQCLLANFRPVVSMKISVGSHFSGTLCVQ